jgi:hypothetical protein
MKQLVQILFVGLLLGISNIALAQDLTQTIRGTVVDKESQFPLIGVTVVVKTSEGNELGTTSDVEGKFKIENVPLGRQSVSLSYIGYTAASVDNIIITSAKETVLKIEMEEAVTELGTVEIIGQKNGEVNNEMATVSSRAFSVEETNRYAGSRGEPARMASNFAGVQGADDSRNDIVIRGNSPQGVLWRLDGINIPNPNHFNIAGTAGGPVTILNNKFLANSDFFTSAFPAEYGNAIAGAFDLKMRNGNNQKHEFSGQLGFLGTELMAEGPINKEKGSSYLATFRYSTLQLFSALNINVGTDAVPSYYDGAFRFNFPLKKGGNLAFWGIGGDSQIDIVLSDAEGPSEETLIYGSNDRDQYFSTNMFTTGLTYTQPLNKDTYIKGGLAYSQSNVYANHDYISRRVENGKFVDVTTPPILDYEFLEGKYSAYLHYNKKINKKLTMKLGVNVDVFDLAYTDSVVTVTYNPDSTLTFSDWTTRWNADDMNVLLQPFVQFKYRASEKLTLTGGITSTYYSVNDKSISPIEPRVGMSYDLGKGQKLNLGAGLHSQMQSNYLYYYGDETVGNAPIGYNKDAMGLTKSIHTVAGYNKTFKNNMRFMGEVYYQYLYDIPVNTYESSYSLVNSGSGFSRLFPDSLENSGVAQNYGLEMTVEKFFSGGYYFLVTASLFDAKYKGSDDVWRNSIFNGQYAFNALFAKEFTFKNGTALNIGGKVTTAGGRWFGPVDEAASQSLQEIIYVDETVNTEQFRPYFRLDSKISFTWNRPRVTHEFAIDLVNLLRTENILTLTYAPNHPTGNPIQEEYQLGFLPLFYYKIDF